MFISLLFLTALAALDSTVSGLLKIKLSCSPAHVEFYLGGELKDNTFYFDPRSIW